jgi:hypothetical protein
MRTLWMSMLLAAGVSAVASAQQVSRFDVGPVARVDRVFIEGGAGGPTTVAGLTASVRIWKALGVEGEWTWASHRIERSYEGWFVSFAGPNATREEIERLAPTARRTLGYVPGAGGAAALVVRDPSNVRVRLGARLGVAGRSYTETSDFTILTIPEGIDPALVARHFQNSSNSRIRGGLLFGADALVALTGHLSIVPEVRFVYGGPARIGNKHREAGFGVRGIWGF